MRGNGNNMSSVKIILKILQENFCTWVHNVVIIKPDNFWQKQRTSIASHKYKFETSTISIEALSKLVDESQLTFEFDGQLSYDHSQWIDIRLSLEEFLWHVADMLDRLDDIQDDLDRSDFAEDVPGAKHALDSHAEMKKKILKLPIEDLDVQGKKLITKLSGTDAGNRASEDASHSSSQQQQGQAQQTKQMPANPDMAAMLAQVLKQMDAVHNGQQHLLTVWQHKKNKLDQCFQLRLFEQDCEKVG